MFRRLTVKRGNLSLYLLLLLVAVSAMIGVRQCSSPTIAPRNEHIAGGDTLNIAIEISPMSLATVGDSLGGYYYNLLQRIGNEHGRPMRFHPFTQLKDALIGLDEGRYQLVVSDIPATSEMKSRYIFIEPGEIDRQVLVQLRKVNQSESTDSIGGHNGTSDNETVSALAIPSQFHLGGMHVTLPKGSPFATRIRNLSHEIGDTIIVDEDPAYSSEQLIILTALGEIQLTVASERLVNPMLARYPQLDASIPVSFNQFQGWAMLPADSLLRDTIASWLATTPSEKPELQSIH